MLYPCRQLLELHTFHAVQQWITLRNCLLFRKSIIQINTPSDNNILIDGFERTRDRWFPSEIIPVSTPSFYVFLLRPLINKFNSNIYLLAMLHKHMVFS
jgi:hypothetical protein